jgi:nickel-dependent lactate racemase
MTGRGTRSVALAYGSGSLAIDVPDDATVVLPRHRPHAPDPLGTLRAAIDRPVAGPPLRDLVHVGQRVAISVCDITRPQPRHLQLAALSEVLDGIVRDEDVVVLVATGTHRASTEAERLEMLGPEVLARWRVVDHDARDDGSLVDLGMVGDVPVALNREWVAADLRITTGFVEPHFFAGFSGGPKMVAPGLAGLDTVLALHNAARIGDPRATWGVTIGNPVHDAIRAIAAESRVDFALDVLIDDQHRITRAFGGEVLAMHAAATATAREEAMQPVEHPFDIVVTTNSGYPLDQNLYQAVKGMSAAATVAVRGGTIVCAAECRDGLPAHGRYAALLAEAESPEALMARIQARPETVPDQWQVQVQARIQARARVLLRADGLSDAQVRAAHLEPTPDVSRAVASLLDVLPAATVCVLPQGPQTIPYLV